MGYDFGGAPRAVTCGTASLIVAGPRPGRRRITLTNDSDTVIYLSKGQQAYLNQGLRLNPTGGVLIDELDTQGQIYTGPWAAITSAATKVLLVNEE